MVSLVGSVVNQLNQRFRVIYDGPPTYLWRIYDMQHDDIRNQHDVDFDLPDTSDAVTILTEEACIEMVRERERQGLLELPEHSLPIVPAVDEEAYKEMERAVEEATKVIEAVSKENGELRNKLNEQQGKEMSRDKLLDTFVKLSEHGDLNDRVIDALQRLA